MRTNRPDIARAVGMLTGAVLCFFVVKFIVLFFGGLVFLLLILKRIMG
jgi:hypothetical protein